MSFRGKSRTGQDKREHLFSPQYGLGSRQAARRQGGRDIDEQIVAVAELEELGVDLRNLNGHSLRYLERDA